ncbi:MAG: DUF1579 domain-containing protein [Ignavibacteriales bacterium]|nr:MAG: DUF1579 domain-containing protein [Ignavibacteriales bacterium]
MKNILLFSVCLLMMFSFQSMAQEGEQMDPQMKAWMEYMTPGDMHKMLEKSNGTWNTKVTMWMAPGTEPMMSEGTTVNEMIFGGRYQKSSHSGDMMGMPMEGMNLLAFDNATEKFQSVWIDNMGTGMMLAEGKYDEATKKVDMNGTYVDPMDGTKKPFRQTFEVVDENTQVFEMFLNDEKGSEFKTMHIEYKRQ